ncbi:hypothetical protein D8M04_08115 [Oceanobacillus piezotolerans]|uniref:CHY-type domain-containing protein n=1 Tax=Oceanobacillus piezotolerans TaxID=2448030 RepID=A0A498D586_9BACI|nr:CHY zinc finger protein [Oceanobacillus piezotolerans]RLL44839.1 hypothetical protein D8M04_08115 [Oceanobacillus piezotolerans]
MKIYGFPVDSQGRCKHYHGVMDTISIKFKCCGKFYPCYKCHDETTEHIRQAWGENEFQEKAIFCGVCQTELTIHEYLSGDKCSKCQTVFNPNCSKHYSYYFKVE